MCAKPRTGQLHPRSSCIIGMIIGKGKEQLVLSFEIKQSLNIPRIRTEKKSRFGLIVIFERKHTFEIEIEQTIPTRIARKLGKRMIIFS